MPPAALAGLAASVGLSSSATTAASLATRQATVHSPSSAAVADRPSIWPASARTEQRSAKAAVRWATQKYVAAWRPHYVGTTTPRACTVADHRQTTGCADRRTSETSTVGFLRRPGSSTPHAPAQRSSGATIARRSGTRLATAPSRSSAAGAVRQSISPLCVLSAPRSARNAAKLATRLSSVATSLRYVATARGKDTLWPRLQIAVSSANPTLEEQEGRSVVGLPAGHLRWDRCQRLWNGSRHQTPRRTDERPRRSGGRSHPDDRRQRLIGMGLQRSRRPRPRWRTPFVSRHGRTIM
jgi:hypothetical protein